jgi:uncharacterized protein (TIGR02246 family)
MKNLATMCLAGGMAMTVLGCNSQPPDTHDADVAAIQANEAQWQKDYAAKDADKIAAHYADDATLIAPGMPATKGKAAIGTLIKGMVTDPALSLKFQAARTEVAKSGDVGYTQGSYTMTMTDPQSKKVLNDHGSYVTTYSKQADGSWKAVSDIASSELPPMPPAPPPVAKAKPVKKH